MYYFTRRIARRLKTNQDLYDRYARYCFDRVFHSDFDEEANDWLDNESAGWLATMNEMRERMDFDVERMKKLHPGLFWKFEDGSGLLWGFGVGYDAITTSWAEMVDAEKVTWIYNEVIKKPCMVSFIQASVS